MQMPLCLLLAVSLGITGCDNSGSIKSSLIEPDSVLSINHVDTVYQNTLIVEGFNLVDTTLHLQDKLFSYGISASLPELISPDSAASKLNQLIKADFSDIFRNGYPEAKTDKEHFRKISFRHFVSDSLLSIVIEDLNACHLSEATSEYKVYHFDMKNSRLLTTSDITQAWGMSQVPILNAVAEQITMPPDNSEPLFKPEWLDTVKWKDFNQLKLYKNNSQQIVIIYPLVENGIEAEQIIK